MKKCIVVLAAVGILVLSFASDVFASELVWEDMGRGNLNLKTVLVHPDNPRIIYIGSRQGIFKSEDGGQNWRNIFSVRGGNREVNFLSFALSDRDSLYAATGNGIYFSHNQGKNWERIFKGKSYFENECTTIAVLPSVIYLGTKAGLFVSQDKGRSWHRQSGEIGKTSILAIAYNPKEQNCIYVACVDGVFRTGDAGKSWERIFVAHPVENGDNGDQISEDQDEAERFSEIRYISIDQNNLNVLYIATGKGVYRSQNKGKSWEMLSDYGLLSKEVKFLLISLKSTIYAVTKSGIFGYANERWHELSLGLTAGDIRFLAQDNQGNLYAACDKGLFKSVIEESRDYKQNCDAISLYYKNEPDINVVQQAVIRYAEVEPEKIMRWRKQAAKKAWLPQVSVGVDRNTTDLWHWEGGSTTKADDDILRRGRDNIDWDITLSWDLGELIYNDDQANIDVRSRLLVQLRDDILDEATKLYFERLRVKMELDNLSIEDRKKRFEKELRLRELTAFLDALTGGFFSQKLKIDSKTAF